MLYDLKWARHLMIQFITRALGSLVLGRYSDLVFFSEIYFSTVYINVLAFLLLGFGHNTLCLVDSLIYSGGDGLGFVLVETLLYRSSLRGVPVERGTRWSTVY